MSGYVNFTQPKLDKAYNSPCPELNKKFTSIRQVNTYVNTYKYIASGQHWETAQEFFKRGGGNCIDFVLAKRALLQQNHLAKNNFVLLVRVRKTGEAHAVLIARDEQRKLDYVLDSRHDAIHTTYSKSFKREYQVLGVAQPSEI